MIELAAPSCPECEQPVRRVEMTWCLSAGGEWLPEATMVCSNKHRTLVVPL